MFREYIGGNNRNCCGPIERDIAQVDQRIIRASIASLIVLSGCASPVALKGTDLIRSPASTNTLGGERNSAAYQGPGPGWVNSASNDFSVHWMYLPSRSRKGDRVQAWTITNTIDGRGRLGDRSDRLLSEYDCRNRSVRILYFSYFSGFNATGRALGVDSKPSEPLPIPPATVGELELRLACER